MLRSLNSASSSASELYSFNNIVKKKKKYR